MYRFFSYKNKVIVICRSGRHRSVANAKLWSNTLTRCGDVFWETRPPGTVRNAANSHSEFFKYTMNTSKPSVYDVFLCQAVGNDHDHNMRKEPSTNFKGKRQVPPLHPPKRAQVSEPWANWQIDWEASMKALVLCLQKRDVPRKTDQSMIEAAKCKFHKLMRGRGGGVRGRLGSSDATVTRMSL